MWPPFHNHTNENPMYEKYEIQVQLRETKPDGKVRSKHTKKKQVVMKTSHLEAFFQEMPDREKQELIISVFEIDNGKRKKKPFLSKTVFPTSKVEYSKMIRSFDTYYNDVIYVDPQRAPLFPYFAKTQGLKIDVDYFGVLSSDTCWQNSFYSRTIDAAAWSKLGQDWWDFIRYDHIKANIMAAISDPETDPEPFKALLQQQSIIDRTIVKDDDDAWELRQDTKTGKYVIHDDSDSGSVSFSLDRLQSLVDAMVAEKSLNLGK